MQTNIALARLFNEAADMASHFGKGHRRFAYRNAATGIIEWPAAVTAENALQIPGVGPAIAGHIKEYCDTGKIAFIETWRCSPRVTSAAELGRIAGVGPSTIEKWNAEGIYTMADLRMAIGSKKVFLTKMQKYGLKYCDDLNARIPRDEVTQLGALFKQFLPSAVTFEIVGSYRRGAADSGDIDILITDKNAKIGRPSLKTFTALIEAQPWFIDVLSTGIERLTFIMFSPFSNRARQIDILSVAAVSYATALNYFTGSWEHNTMMRSAAKALGMKLNQTGLFNGNKRIATPEESDIYAALGMAYIAPHDR